MSKEQKIYLVYADYRPKCLAPPYPVRGHSKKEVKEYFQRLYTWLKVFKVEEYTGDPNELRWFW